MILPPPPQNPQTTPTRSLYNFARPSFFFYGSCHPDRHKTYITIMFYNSWTESVRLNKGQLYISKHHTNTEILIKVNKNHTIKTLLIELVNKSRSPYLCPLLLWFFSFSSWEENHLDYILLFYRIYAPKHKKQGVPLKRMKRKTLLSASDSSSELSDALLANDFFLFRFFFALFFSSWTYK